MSAPVVQHVALSNDVRKIAVVADTHSAPHEGTAKALAAISPDAIFHAGDIGDLDVLDQLRGVAPLYAIRGNIDEPGSARRGSAAAGQRGVIDEPGSARRGSAAAGQRGVIDEPGSARRGSAAAGQRGVIDMRADALPDILVIDAPNKLRMMIVHIGVYGPKLRAEVATRARAERAHLVVCGHSHVPFIGIDRGIYVFNPGSCGPRRAQLPIVLGWIDLSPTGVKLAHVNCETGAAWSPP